MTNINSKYLGGFVFKSRNDLLLRDLFSQINQNDFRVKSIGTANKKNWTDGTIVTSTPFRKEEDAPPYKYAFYFIEKEGVSLSILLSENKELVVRLLSEMQKIDRTISPIRIATEIVLDSIDNYCFGEQEKKDKFSINYLYARISGMQDRLTSATLYGRDVLKSKLYLDYKDSFDALTCGLAIEESAYSFSEISRVSKDGYISFYVNDKVFDNVQLTTKFLHDNKAFIYDK